MPLCVPIGFNKHLIISLKISEKETATMSEAMQKVTNIHEAEKKANELYNKYFGITTAIIKDDFATDLYTLLQKLEIDIMIQPLKELDGFDELKKLSKTADIFGFLLRDNNGYTMVVEKNSTMEQKRFVIAHEIAHKVLNHICSSKPRSISFIGKYSLESDIAEEMAANAFAEILLMPEIILRHVLTITSDRVRIAKSLGVSRTMLQRRLNKLGIS